MIYFNKLFKIPGPKELGMSDCENAMAIDGWRNYPGELTWDDYYAKVKKDYPIKFFIASSVPNFFIKSWNKISRSPKEIFYWLQCHMLKKHRYHLIDLRETKEDVIGSEKPYRYGWADSDVRMELAIRKLIIDFVEKELPNSFEIASKENADKDDGINQQYFGCKEQYAKHLELMEIYNYWKTGRNEIEKRYWSLFDAWHRAKKLGVDGDQDNLEVKNAWKALHDQSDLKDKVLDEMMIRSVKIRKTLWT